MFRLYKVLPALAIFAFPGIASPEIAANLDGIVNASARMKERPSVAPIRDEDYRGWGYLAEKLRADGITDAELAAVFKDERMPHYSLVTFSPNPRESSHMYRGFTSGPRLTRGRQFIAEHRAVFDRMEKAYPVDRHIVGAIFLVETNLGKITGRELIVNRLARLASVRAPKNLSKNLSYQRRKNPSLEAEKLEARAEYLENLFYPEVLALFRIARLHRSDILDMRGSSAGAFGIPQFLPSNYLKFGIDADKSGTISLFDPADAIWSTANFLAHHGWRTDADATVKSQAIWKYNPSEPYVKTVLEVAEILAKPAGKSAPKPAKKAAKKRGSASKS